MTGTDAGALAATLETLADRLEANLEVVATDAGRGLIMVKGGVPGPKGGVVLLSDAKKRSLPEDVPFPAGLRAEDEPEPEAAEEAAPEAEAETEDAAPEAEDAAESGEEESS